MTVECWKDLDSIQVIRFCCDKDYYNNGSNEDYDKMLKYVHKHRYKMHLIPHLKFVAQDILDHTDTAGHYVNVEMVMQELLEYFKIHLYLETEDEE